MKQRRLARQQVSLLKKGICNLFSCVSAYTLTAFGNNDKLKMQLFY